MNRNVGTIDSVLRVVLGIVLIGLAFQGVIGLWGYIGFVPLLTGIAGNCPLYRLIGVNTCKTAGAPKSPGAQ